ncbi:MAG: histidine--tRNA ligase [Thermoplasmata archaeon]|nr:MAG: histidine--tRNA ligase [Thermoplasmata archaeon]
MFKIPRGTRDFTPDEMHKRRYIENSMRNTFQTFGYREIQTPMFENLELFTAKSGETIIEELYAFKDKSGRDLALRPELTAPVIRLYVDKLQMKPKPLKLFYFGSCFRYDRPQKGRYREFTQAGCELIGTDTPEAYAELIALAYTLLKNVGLKNIKLNIGNLTVLSTIFKKIGLTKDQQRYIIPLIDKALFEELYSALQDFNIENTKITDFLEILQTSDLEKIKKYIMEDETVSKELDKLEDIFDLLNNCFKIKNYQIKMSIVRGLDYYTGLVFEIEAPMLGAEKQLCGGGAYELISLFGGKDTPTAGFAVGFDRTILALETEGQEFPLPGVDVYVIPVNREMVKKTLEITQLLREKGLSVDVDLLRRGLSKSLKYANSLNAWKAVIVGPDELKKNAVTLRDLKSGEQKIVKIKELPDTIF